jgi:hypothetical protein
MAVSFNDALLRQIPCRHRPKSRDENASRRYAHRPHRFGDEMRIQAFCAKVQPAVGYDDIRHQRLEKLAPDCYESFLLAHHPIT